MPRRIGVKAMGLFVQAGRLLGQQGPGASFLRLLGGSVEFGEAAETALRRELVEELGAELGRVVPVTVVENRFVLDGQQGHEVVFLFAADFRDDSFYRRSEIPFLEAGGNRAVWRPVADILSGSIPLYPVADYAGLIAAAEEKLR